MKLLVDVGNRRVKWATSDQINVVVGEPIASQTALDNVITNQMIMTDSTARLERLAMQFRKLPVPQSVWMSCVSTESVKNDVIKACQHIWKLSPLCIEVEGDALGVENGYENPAMLGADRWAANIGARHIAGHLPLVVIDAGTAVTIDYINGEGRFLGGIILPGMVTMVQSLYTSTDQIRAAHSYSCDSTGDVGRNDARKISLEHIQLINANTASAVENGGVLAVVAGVDRAVEQHLSATDGELKIIVTGGDAECIARLSIHDMKCQPNLVLIGLLLISEESAQ